MLTQYVSVYLLLVYVEDLCQIGAQTDGIQNGTGTEHLALGQTGVLQERIGQDIHGVRHQDINSVGGYLGDLVGNILDDTHVGLHQIQTGLAGLSADAGGDDNCLRACRVGIITCDNVTVADERGCLLNVKGFAHSSFGVDVDQNYFGCGASCQKGESGGCTDGSCTDDCNFLFHGCAPLYR